MKEITIPLELAETLRSALESKVVMKEATEKQKKALEELESIMFPDEETVAVIEVSNEEGTIVLVDLLNEEGKPTKSPWLMFYKDYKQTEKLEEWDNSMFIDSLCKSLAQGEETVETETTKEFCEEFNINYSEFRLSLLQIYKKAVKLKIF